jgi:drug/metabolite transporter (DMT)-like permease
MRHLHVPPAAIGLIALAVLCFSCLDSIVKALSARYPVPLLVWARYGVQAIALGAWLLPRMGRQLLATRAPRLQVVRGVVLLLSSLFFMNALRYLPLADATALNYSTPTLVIVLAVVLLHERMTPPRIAFVLAGALGMVLIVRPGREIFHGAALLALGAAVCYAFYQILTRKLAAEDSRVLAFYPALTGAVLMTLALPWYPLPAIVHWLDLALIVVGGLCATVGHFLIVLAFQRAPASALTPFTYLQLVWATLLGWIVFREFPDGPTLLGMGVIAGSGLLLMWHERRAQAAATLAEPTVID